KARPLLDAVLEELARPLGERGGLRLADGNRRADRAGAVQAFEQQSRAAVVDDGDGDGPFVLLRFGNAGGHHLVAVGGGQAGFATHVVSSQVKKEWRESHGNFAARQSARSR